MRRATSCPAPAAQTQDEVAELWRLTSRLVRDPSVAAELVEGAARRFRGAAPTPRALRLAALREGLDWIDARGFPGAADPHAGLRRHVASLPRDERDAFLLADGLGLATPDAACALGIPAREVASRLHRARLRLAARLREPPADA